MRICLWAGTLLARYCCAVIVDGGNIAYIISTLATLSRSTTHTVMPYSVDVPHHMLPPYPSVRHEA